MLGTVLDSARGILQCVEPGMNSPMFIYHIQQAYSFTSVHGSSSERLASGNV